MKKLCIFLTIFTLYQLTSRAQSGFGVVGGTGLVTTSDGFLESVGFSNSVGMHLGIFYNLEISEKFSLRPKLLYSQQGGRKDDSSGPISILGESLYKMDYLAIPF